MPVNTSIPRKRGKGKVKVIEKRKMTQAMKEKLETDDLDVTVSLIQALIPYGLKAVEEKLQAEVERLAGRRYRHGKENVRWGKQSGSVYLRDQKIPIMVPRVRDKNLKEEMPLKTYQKLQEPYLSDKQTMLKLLNGISTRRYRRCAEFVPEVFGISPSNLSKRFKKTTGAMIRRLRTRSLSHYDFICVFIDGKRYANDGLLIALGVTIEGEKVILGAEQTHSENEKVTAEFIEGLIKRGLKFEHGLLFIVDGSKGLIKAIESRFQEYAFIQRCQQHKLENVASYLNDGQKELCKTRLREAYGKTSYKEAKAALENLNRELMNVNMSAAGSLLEGMEETLTLYTLGLAPELRRSFNSTNCIESVMSQLGQYTDKVDRWRNSYQLLRWTSAALLEIEPRLNPIEGSRYLNLLRLRMKKEIRKRREKKYESIDKQHELLETTVEV